MGFKEEKALQMQPSSKEPSEGLSDAYQRFLVEKCRAHFEPRDGTYRSKSGYRYCSCDMCGATSTMNIGGRELCDFHYGHTSSKVEEDFWTQRMHDLRPLVAIALQLKTYIQPEEEKDQRLLNLFDELLKRHGLPPRAHELQTPFRYLCTLIEEEFGRKGIAPDPTMDKAKQVRSFSTQAIERFEARMRAMPIIAKRESSPRTPEPPFPTEEEAPL